MQVTIEEIQMLSTMLAKALGELRTLTQERDEWKRLYEGEMRTQGAYSGNHVE